MLAPRIFNDSFVDDLFDDMFRFPSFSNTGSRNTSSMMRTDVQDLGNDYQLDIELPGYAKEDVHAELSKGYLTISAHKESNSEEKNAEGKYVRRERYSGSCQRSFYIGEGLKEEDIHASFENGILKLVFPKEEQRKAVEEKKYIAIE